MAWIRFKQMALQTEGIHTVSGMHQEIRFDVRKDGGAVNVRHREDVKKLLDTGRYVIALEHPEHGGLTYDEAGWEVVPVHRTASADAPQASRSIDPTGGTVATAHPTNAQRRPKGK